MTRPAIPLPNDRVTLRAKCNEIRDSGDRHASYWFRFDVEEVLDGTWPHTEVQLHELDADFGGGRLVALAGDPSATDAEAYCTKSVVLRVITETRTDEPAHAVLLWSAAPDDASAFASLEAVLWTLETALREHDPDGFASAMEDPTALDPGVFERVAARASSSPDPLAGYHLSWPQRSDSDPEAEPVEPSAPLGEHVWLRDDEVGVSLEFRVRPRGWVLVSFESDA